MHSRWRVRILLLLTVLPAPLLAQFQEGVKIQGRLLDAQTMQPLENVNVELVYRGALQDRDVTDSRGEFEFLRLGMTEYIVRIRQAGFVPQERVVNMNVEVGGRGSVFNVTFLLEPDAKSAARPGTTAPALSARELQIPEAARKEFEKGFKELNERNQPERSLAHFQKALEMHPDFDEAYVQLGLAYFLLRQRANALRTLDRAVQIYPQNARAYALFGKVLIDTNQVDPGIEALERALAVDETLWGAHADLGAALLYKKQLDPALKHARRALELNDTVPMTHVLLASVLMERKEFAAAAKVQDEILRRFPDGKLAAEVRKQRDDARKQLKQQAP